MMKRNFAWMLIAAMLLTLLSACSGTAEPEATTSEAIAAPVEDASVTASAGQETEPVQETAEELQSEEPEDMEEAEAGEEVIIGLDYYYLQEEPLEVTVMFQYAFFFASFFTEGWGASPWWDALGQTLNCEFVLTEVPSTSYQERLNLSIIAGDTADLLTAVGSFYATGASGALADGVIYDLSGYLEEYAPNYWAWIIKDEDTLRNMMTDDGELPVMYNIMTERGEISDGLWVRQDWLDQLGLSIPTTPDEFYEVLLACKTEFGCETAYYQMITADPNAVGISAEGVWNAFGPTNFYVKLDGTVGYGPSEDYYFEYLAYLKKLASEGLFMVSDMTDSSSSDLFAQGNIAINGDSADNVPSYLALLEDDNAYMRAMAALGEPTEYGDFLTYLDGDSIAAATLSVSTDCAHPELMVKIMDYLFTEEGSLLASYGIEGLSYEIVDGEPQFTDLIANNPDGLPVRAALGYYTNPGLCGLIAAHRTEYLYEDWQREATEIWASAYTGNSGTLPIEALSFTVTEQESISTYLSDMMTYINEFVYSVVFGDTALTETTVSAYLDTLMNTMHLPEILEVYTAAYQRYLNRSLV